MKNACAVVALLAIASIARAELPASITHARLEARPGTSPSAALEAIGHGATPEWAGWSVPSTSDARDICCFTNNFKRRGCSLTERDNGWGSSDNDQEGEPPEIYVLVEVKSGTPTRLRLVSPGCPVDGADRRVVWLGAVDTGASLAALSRLLDGKGDEDKLQEPALAAVAYHRDPKADAILEKRAFDRSLSKEQREQAIFWAGNAREAAGYKLIDRVLNSEPNGDLREHAVFALTQSHEPGRIDRIKRVAVEDKDDDVRAQALFWLAQTNAPGAGEWIVARLDAEEDEHVREQAVFALSQLKDGTDWLLKVLRSKRDPETLRRALFWLGQSDDPRALAELEKILDK